MSDKIKDPCEGHRQRLRDKFWEHGLDKLTDAEVLELLLSFGTPRRDCKLAARTMLQAFGTLRDVFEADRDELAKIPGAGPSNIVAIKLVHAIAGKYLEKRLIQRDYLSGSAQVLEYLRYDMESRDKEIFKLLHLNNDNQVLAVEDISRGSVAGAFVHPREVMERAIILRSTSMVFVHNHPTGSIEPSEDDQRLTRRLVHVAYLAEMKVMDHIILGHGGDYFSFRDKGLIMLYEEEIRQTYNIKPRPGGALLHEVDGSVYYPKKIKSRAKKVPLENSKSMMISEAEASWEEE